MSPLTSREALTLTAHFAFTADRMRAANEEFDRRARICEIASRIAFLRAHLIARQEQVFPQFGESSQRAIYNVA